MVLGLEAVTASAMYKTGAYTVSTTHRMQYNVSRKQMTTRALTCVGVTVAGVG